MVGSISLKTKRSDEPEAVEKRLTLAASEWVQGPMLGEGGFGSVYLVMVKEPELSFFAMKSASGSQRLELVLESKLLEMLAECPFVIDSYGHNFTVDADGTAICNLFLEYAEGGTVGDLVMKYGVTGLNVKVVRKYTECMLKWIEYIHDMGYVHCDIKPENILLVTNPANSSDYVAKIADFGLAKWAEEEKGSVRGTAMYLSPETVNEGIQGKPSDIWALGCVVLKMLTGRQPWDAKPGAKFYDLVASKVPHVPAWLSEDAKDFLGKCFLRDPLKRFTASDLLKHPFVSMVGEVRHVTVELPSPTPTVSKHPDIGFHGSFMTLGSTCKEEAEEDLKIKWITGVCDLNYSSKEEAEKKLKLKWITGVCDLNNPCKEEAEEKLKIKWITGVCDLNY